jgi:hypothetical protein
LRTWHGFRPGGQGRLDARLGGVVVIDDQTCIVEFALRTISFYQHESCGWCIPCREGTDWLKKSLTRFHAGFGDAKDIDNIQYLAENMLGRTFCPLGDAAAMPTMAFVKKFRKEFEEHLNGKPCPFAKHVELAVVYSPCTDNRLGNLVCCHLSVKVAIRWAERGFFATRQRR